MEIQSAIKAVIAGHDLSGEEMISIMRQIMTGECTPSQIGGFLVGLRMKGETVDEISAAAQVMRELATRVEVHGSTWSTPAVPAVTPRAASISRPPAPSWRPARVRWWPSTVIVR